MKRLRIIVVLSVIIFFLGNVGIVQSIGQNEKICKNIFIEDVNVSNLTKLEAKNKIEQNINNNKNLSLVLNDIVFNLNLDDIEVIYDIDKAIEEAYNIGRNDNLINNIKSKLDLKHGNRKVININYNYDDKKLEEYIDYICREINTKPVDASIKLENNKLEYTKESYGRSVDASKLKEIIVYKIKDKYISENEIPITFQSPKYLYSELSKIDTVLGTYETYFNPENENRVSNIKVASDATSGLILNKGSEFSFNKYIDANYNKLKNAPVIINGKLQDGVGGGICQVSSTIYNAALYSGLEITSIKNHSIPSGYISKGRDATVSVGIIDFKFKNNLYSPVFIHNEVYENKIISTIYGGKQDKKDIEILTEITEELPNKVQIKSSDELCKGEKKIFQKGREGYKVNTFRFYKDKKVKEFINESYYPPLDEIILYGTKEKGINSEII